MWKIKSTGVALWETSGTNWRFDARGGADGIACLAPQGGTFEGGTLFQLQPVGKDQLPIAAEQFVRGDQWHVSFPQGDGSYSLHCVFRPILSDERRLVLETTLAIQTSLLDSQPMIDVRAVGGRLRCFTPTDGAPRSESSSSDKADQADRGATTNDPHASAVSRVISDAWSLAVLLGPRDYPWTFDLSSAQEIRLRLFGEFLEKGVIRKARPWIVLEREEVASDDRSLVGLWEQLCQTPLPLT